MANFDAGIAAGRNAELQAFRRNILSLDAMDNTTAIAVLGEVGAIQARTEIAALALTVGREPTYVESFLRGVTANPLFSLTPGLPDEKSRESLRAQQVTYLATASALSSAQGPGGVFPFVYEVKRLVDMSVTACVAAEEGQAERQAIPEQLDNDLKNNAKKLVDPLLTGIGIAGVLAVAALVAVIYWAFHGKE